MLVSLLKKKKSNAELIEILYKIFATKKYKAIIFLP